MTVVAPSSSPTLSGFATSVRPLGAASLSSRKIVSPVTVTNPDAPVTWMVSSGSSITSLVGVSVNVPEPLAAPAPMVTVKSDTVA